jgi:hypothetical protein
MIRLACGFGLLALAAIIPLLAHLDGATATVFSFVGCPALGLALLIYAVARWRAGAFQVDGAEDEHA